MTISWSQWPPMFRALAGGLGGMVRLTVEVARGLAAHPNVQPSVLADPSAATFWADIVSSDRVHRYQRSQRPSSQPWSGKAAGRAHSTSRST